MKSTICATGTVAGPELPEPGTTPGAAKLPSATTIQTDAGGLVTFGQYWATWEKGRSLGNSQSTEPVTWNSVCISITWCAIPSAWEESTVAEEEGCALSTEPQCEKWAWASVTEVGEL